MIRRVSRARGSHASSSHSAERGRGKEKGKMFTLPQGEEWWRWEVGGGGSTSAYDTDDEARVARVLPQHRISKGGGGGGAGRAGGGERKGEKDR